MPFSYSLKKSRSLAFSQEKQAQAPYIKGRITGPCLTGAGRELGKEGPRSGPQFWGHYLLNAHILATELLNVLIEATSSKTYKLSSVLSFPSVISEPSIKPC